MDIPHDEAVSVLIQVLYALHQGHVQLLMGDYKTRVLDVHDPDAFPKVRAPNLGKDELPRTILDSDVPAPNPEQAVVDISKMTTPSQRIPKTQVRLSVAPVVVKRTRLTPLSPLLHRWKHRIPAPFGNPSQMETSRNSSYRIRLRWPYHEMPGV
jgi:hypothetical protein